MQSSNSGQAGKKNEVSGGISLEDYIYIEAKEKCFEIEVQAHKEFEKAKAEIIQREHNVIKDSFETRYKAKEIEAKIKHSSNITQSRFNKMRERNKDVLRILHHAQVELCQRIQKDSKYYKDILKRLIVQGLIRLMEKQVKVRCLKKDEELVNSVLKECRQQFHDLVKKELAIDGFWVQLELDSENLEIRTLPELDDSQIENQEHQINIQKEEDHKKW